MAGTLRRAGYLSTLLIVGKRKPVARVLLMLRFLNACVWTLLSLSSGRRRDCSKTVRESIHFPRGVSGRRPVIFSCFPVSRLPTARLRDSPSSPRHRGCGAGSWDMISRASRQARLGSPCYEKLLISIPKHGKHRMTVKPYRFTRQTACLDWLAPRWQRKATGSASRRD